VEEEIHIKTFRTEIRKCENERKQKFVTASCFGVGAVTTLTPRGTVLPEKLTGRQLVKKFPAFYRTRKFIAAFTTAQHLSLS
jgi:hypothetical protein